MTECQHCVNEPQADFILVQLSDNTHRNICEIDPCTIQQHSERESWIQQLNTLACCISIKCVDLLYFPSVIYQYFRGKEVEETNWYWEKKLEIYFGGPPQINKNNGGHGCWGRRWNSCPGFYQPVSHSFHSVLIKYKISLQMNAWSFSCVPFLLATVSLCVLQTIKWGVHWLWMFAEQHLDEGQGGLVQLLQLLLVVAHIELGDVEKGLLLVLAQERRDSSQHHVGQNTNTPKHTTWNSADGISAG